MDINANQPQLGSAAVQNPDQNNQQVKKTGYIIFGAVIVMCIALMLVFIFEKKAQKENPSYTNVTATIPTAVPQDVETKKFQAVVTGVYENDRNNEFDKVASELKTYVDSDPRREEKLKAKADLAAAYFNDMDYTNAIRTYEELGNESEEYKLVSLHGLAQTYREKGELQKAIDYYKLAMKYMEEKGDTDSVRYVSDKKAIAKLEKLLNEQ